MKKFFIIITLFTSTSLVGNGIAVSNVSFNNVANTLSFDLAWENSFSEYVGDPDFFDGAWVFVKYSPNGGGTWFHANILDSTAVSGFVQYISYDDLGLMIYSLAPNSGTIAPTTFTIQLDNLLGAYQDFKVFATEMVYIDQGDFNAGDGAAPGRFYADGNTFASWNVTSEDAIPRGNGPGQFHQEGSSSTQDLNAGFPKGWQSIFCMKYKITAEQYKDFLNCLTRAQQNARVQADLSGTTASNKYVMTNTPSPTDRNPIACPVNIGTGAIEFFLDLDETNPGNSANDGANIALNHLTPSDILAYFDWSGLRPMSELEFEKICRGTDMPAIANEYAWGTDTHNPVGAITNSGTNTESTSNVGILNTLFSIEPLRAGFAATSTSNRISAGGAFWGVMDMHNLGEFMYGVESLNFVKFAYGDGEINSLGNAVVQAWTAGAQLLCSQDPSSPAIEPISQGKTAINPVTRSAYMGARGLRRLRAQ